MYIVINSRVRLYTALCTYEVLRSSAQATSSTLITRHNPPPPHPKFVLTLNRRIFKNSKKLLHSFVEMSKFYLNMQYSRKLFCNFLSWSPSFEYRFLAYIFFKFEILNFLFITFFSTSCLIHICINLENRLVTFWVEVRFIWRQTDIHGFVMYSS